MSEQPKKSQEYAVTGTTGKTCSSRSFRALLGAQFLGAFNDNLFKTIASILVINEIVGNDSSALYASLAGALFFLPYILFSAFAGWCSDRFSKSDMIRWTKEMELVVMCIGLFAFMVDSTELLLSCVFLMGAQSALFSPSKLGILPEILDLSELSKANGYLEFIVFTAIIIGTASAGFVSDGSFGNPGLFCIGIACIGIILSLFIKRVPARSVDNKRNPLPIDPILPNIRILRKIAHTNSLWMCTLGIAFFWSVGALFQLNILFFSKEILHFDDRGTALILASIGLGIGIGSILAGTISKGAAELGLLPVGAGGMVLFSALLGLYGQYQTIAFPGIFFLGLSSGFFIIPLTAYLQAFSPIEERGRYMAASNFLSNVGMLSSTFLFLVFRDYFDMSAKDIFSTIGIAALAVTIGLTRILPGTTARAITWIKEQLVKKKSVIKGD